MKKLFFALSVVMLAVACDDDSGGSGSVSATLQNALLDKYPTAENVEWATRGAYILADFVMPDSGDLEYEAWFSPSGEWYMTESNIAYTDLPAAVKQAFEASDFATWQLDDVDMLERKNSPTLYIIDVEGLIEGVVQDVELFYTTEGLLVKGLVDTDIDDSYEDYIPQYPSESVESYILQAYPNAQLIDVERKGSSVEVEILDGSNVRSLLFDMHNKWVRTLTEMRPSDLPQAVVSAINSLYSSYSIDDVEFVQTANAEYYIVEIESGPQEVELKITPAGEIL